VTEVEFKKLINGVRKENLFLIHNIDEEESLIEVVKKDI